MTESNKLFTVRMPESLREEFIEKAQSEGTSARQLILAWINQYLGKAQTTEDGDCPDRVKKLEDKINVIESQLATLLSSHETSHKTSQPDSSEIADNSHETSHETSQPDSSEIADNSHETSHETSQPDSSEIADNSHETSHETSQPDSSEIADDSHETSHETSQPDSSEIADDSQADSYKNNGIAAQQLGKRLGRSGEAVRQQQKKGEKAFAEWTRNLDPDGKAWKANREGKQVKYYLV
jgi:hypothetical protein